MIGPVRPEAAPDVVELTLPVRPVFGPVLPVRPVVGPAPAVRPVRPVVGPALPGQPTDIFARMMETREAAVRDSGVGNNPALADHERSRATKRKTTVNPDPRRRGAAKDRATKEPNVDASQRVREFPNHSLKA